MATSKQQPLKTASSEKDTEDTALPLKYEDEHFVDSQKPVWNYSLFTDEDTTNFKNGTFYNGYQKFGSQYLNVLNTDGFYFAVWAPNATKVSVIGEFNGWKEQLHPLFVRLDKSGIWEGFIPHIKAGEIYKYYIKGFKGAVIKKTDPYGQYCELRPATASITWQTEHQWNDIAWMKKRKKKQCIECTLECV